MNPVRPLWYYTYVIKSKKDGKFYTDVTSNIDKRFKEHNDGLVFATKYRCPFTLIYFEACLNKNDAYRRERYLKTGMGKRYLKERLNPVRNFRRIVKKLNLNSVGY